MSSLKCDIGKSKTLIVSNSPQRVCSLGMSIFWSQVHVYNIRRKSRKFPWRQERQGWRYHISTTHVWRQHLRQLTRCSAYDRSEHFGARALPQLSQLLWWQTHGGKALRMNMCAPVGFRIKIQMITFKTGKVEENDNDISVCSCRDSFEWGEKAAAWGKFFEARGWLLNQEERGSPLAATST